MFYTFLNLFKLLPLLSDSKVDLSKISFNNFINVILCFSCVIDVSKSTATNLLYPFYLINFLVYLSFISLKLQAVSNEKKYNYDSLIIQWVLIFMTKFLLRMCKELNCDFRKTDLIMTCMRNRVTSNQLINLSRSHQLVGFLSSFFVDFS